MTHGLKGSSVGLALLLAMAGMLGGVSGAAAENAPATQPAVTEPPPAPPVERTTYIAASLDEVWRALTQKEYVRDWFPFPLQEIDLRPGGKLIYGPDGSEPIVVAEVLALDPKRVLVLRWTFVGGPPALQKEHPTKVKFTLDAWGPSTQLNISHDDLTGAPATAASAGPVWDGNIARLKTLLETGRRLAMSFDEARQYAQTRPATQPVDLYNPLAYIRDVIVYVDNLKTARPWYEQTFALSPTSFSSDFFTLGMASPAITVKEVGPQDKAKPGDVEFIFYARDVDALYGRLQEAGVTIVEPLKADRWVKRFAFTGPNGQKFWVNGPNPAVAQPAAPVATAPAGGS